MPQHRDNDGDGLADRPRGDFTKEDGSSYARVDPEEFESYDDVDSRVIIDPGTPGMKRWEKRLVVDD